MRAAKAGIIYFAAVFGAGFLMGTVRVLWLVGRLGERRAELLEAPFMLAVMIASARIVVRRFAPLDRGGRLRAGLLSLALMLGAELGVASIRGRALAEYIASRDPVSGAVYCALLALFALMPLLAAAAD